MIVNSNVVYVCRYLTVLVKMPESVLAEAGEMEEMQLCVEGCPPYERLSTFTQPAMKKSDVRICPRNI